MIFGCRVPQPGKGGFMNFYFTFGSDKHFPHPNGYLIVEAGSQVDAVKKFRIEHPDRTPGIIHCAFMYTQEEWDRLRPAIHSQKPAEIIV